MTRILASLRALILFTAAAVAAAATIDAVHGTSTSGGDNDNVDDDSDAHVHQTNKHNMRTRININAEERETRRPCSNRNINRCMHNSTCEYEYDSSGMMDDDDDDNDGDHNFIPYCNCTTAVGTDGDDSVLFAGQYCEHEATSYCINEGETNNHFCTNGGACSCSREECECVCTMPYYGKHCEFGSRNGLKENRWCGTNWVDAAKECRSPCPSGTDAECQRQLGSLMYKCQSYTGCANEMYGSVLGGGEQQQQQQQVSLLSEESEAPTQSQAPTPSTPNPTEVPSSASSGFSSTLLLPSPGTTSEWTTNTQPLLFPFPRIEEYDALLTFYNDTGGESSWTRNDNWHPENDIRLCEWYGVQCNADGHVVGLSLSGNGLQGFLSPKLFTQLEFLEMVDFTFNKLMGTIPDAIGDADKLQTLMLGNNAFEGGIPSSLGRLSNLQELDLRSNLISYLQYEEGGYGNLRTLILDDNLLQGTIPYNIYLDMKSLKGLSLRGNGLSGSISSDISNLVDLAELDLSFNDLSGKLPNFSVDNESLQINVAGNRLTGIHRKLCLNENWNDFDVGNYGCDGIACPVGTANSEGRQMSDSTPCNKCRDTTSFVGAVECPEDTPPPASSPIYICGLECLNGGTCAMGNFGAEEWCDCPPGYEGTRCETSWAWPSRPTPPPTWHRPSHPPIRPFLPSHPTLSNALDSLPLEYDALVTFYKDTCGESWTRNENWLSSDDDDGISVCEWYGVSCNADGHVLALSLSSNGLKGFLSPKLFTQLKLLEMIDFRFNGLMGTIPDTIGGADKLQTLILGGNALEGGIPSSLSHLSSLQGLDLRSNLFSFFLYESGGYSDLRTLILDDNLLQGTIPYNIYTDMKSLEVLSMRGNRLTGFVSNDLSNLVNLTELDLSFNDLSGMLPNFSVDNPLQINVAGNRLTGIDRNLCLNVNWNDFDVGRHGCDGIACPVGTANTEGRQTSFSTPCTACRGTTFIGAVECPEDTPPPASSPVDICGLECLNGGTCAMGNFGPQEWCDCPPGYEGTRCETSSVRPGRPTPPPTWGPFPPSSPSLSSTLDSLALEYEALLTFYKDAGGESWTQNENWLRSDDDGISVCEWYGVVCNAGGHVLALSLPSNGLQGFLSPELFTQLEFLEMIDFRFNKLTGTIPEAIGGADKLQTLILGDNALEGWIPSSLSRMSNLQELDLRSNFFSFFLYESGGYSDLRTLILDYNLLHRTIPENVYTDMKSLEVLSLRGNKLIGFISNELSNLVNLTELDLSFNDLSGTLPNFSVDNPLQINVAGNRLTGIDVDLCLNENWNDFDVGRYGCDGIACPVGTANTAGRHMSDMMPCTACRGTTFIGAVECQEDTPPPASSPIDICGLECFNGGSCAMGNFGPQEWCDCPPGYEGTRCETSWVWPGRPTPPPTRRPVYYRPSYPPMRPFLPSAPSSSFSLPPAFTGSVDYNECTFYAADRSGRLTSYSTADSGAVFVDIGNIGRVVDIAVDPVTYRAIGLRESEIIEFSLKDGSIIEPGVFQGGSQNFKPLFGAIEFANDKFYGAGGLATGDGEIHQDTVLYEMNARTFQIERRWPLFDTPIVGLAHSSNERGYSMYAISLCEDNSNLYEIDLDLKQSKVVCEDLPACFESLTYLPHEDALYGGTADGCIARIVVDSCSVSDCETSNLDNVRGLSAVCPKKTPSPVATSYISPEDEHEHLSKFYMSSSGPSWVNNTNWLSFEENHKCKWHGILCDDIGNIEGIHLSQNGLVGGGVKYLNYLPSLKYLNLSINALSGSMPSFGLLTQLEVIDFRGNYHGGSLRRDFLASARNLMHIDLSQNRLTGHLHSLNGVPWPSLKYLNMSSNYFASSIPVELGAMHSIEVLDLSGNRFLSEFQESFYRELRNLTYLNLSQNKLVGELPSFEYYPKLEMVNVSHNEMKGEIPTNIFKNSVINGTITLDISHNYFGYFFPDLQLQRLNINAANNQFERIDENVCQREEWNDGDLLRFGCNGLMCPQMTYNKFGRQTSSSPCAPCEAAKFYGTTGCSVFTTRPTRQPASFSYNRPTRQPASFSYNKEEYDALLTFYNDTGGKSWERSDNWLSSYVSVCDWYGVKCLDDRVNSLVLPSNGLVGYLNTKIFAQLPYIEVIDLSSNSLNGEVASFPFSQSLKELNLAGNALTSRLFDRCCPELQVLNLRNNLLSKRLPSFGEFPKLAKLLLGNNSLSGTLADDYSSVLDDYSSTRANLRELDLGANMISGELVSFNDASQLHSFNVSMNLLTGEIPDDFMKASFANGPTRFEPFELDFSFNSLVGTLPAFEADILRINVSGNMLVGLDEEVCERVSWNDRGVSLFGCDAVACPIGTANPQGRQTSDAMPCNQCPDAIYIGSVGCIDEDFVDPTNESGTKKPTTQPSPIPVTLPKTFRLYQFPSFIMIITSDNPQTRTPLSVSELEDVTSSFLLDVSTKSLGVDSSLYITTLNMNDIDQSDLASSIKADQIPNSTIGRRIQNEEDGNLMFLEIDGILGIRDGIFNDSSSIDTFIESTMGTVFQSRDELLDLIQDSGTPALKSVSLVELSAQIEICPNSGLRCHHGSQCTVTNEELFVCDCSTASTLYYEAVDGLQCEFAATQFCSNESDVRTSSFCVNGGECTKSNATVEESLNSRCTCPDPYEGSRCELLQDMRIERSKTIVPEGGASSSNELNAGDLAIIIIIGIGLILTIVIIVQKIKSKTRPQLERKQNVANEVGGDTGASPDDAMEAGLVNQSDVKVTDQLAPPAQVAEEEREEKTELQRTSDVVKNRATPDESVADKTDEPTLDVALRISAYDGGMTTAPARSQRDRPSEAEEEKEEITPFPEDDFQLYDDTATQLSHVGTVGSDIEDHNSDLAEDEEVTAVMELRETTTSSDTRDGRSFQSDDAVASDSQEQTSDTSAVLRYIRRAKTEVPAAEEDVEVADQSSQSRNEQTSDVEAAEEDVAVPDQSSESGSESGEI